jgi:hypothetical protein
MIVEILQNLKYNSEDARLNKLNFTFHQLIQHHGQDIKLLSGIIDYPVPFYFDIDLVRFMFASGHNFYLNETGSGNRTFQSQKLFADIITSFAPEASTIPFAKRGKYAPRELSRNPVPVLYLKRVCRYLLQDKIVPNFVHGPWMQEFVEAELNAAGIVFKEIFDADRLQSELAGSDCRHEACWRRFSNPVFAKKIIEPAI